MNIRNKLLLTSILITGLSVIILGIVAVNNATRTIQMEVENGLNGLVDKKLDLVYSQIDTKQKEIAGLAKLPTVVDAMEQLKSAFRLGVDNPGYLAMDKKIRPTLSQLRDGLTVYDLFLISPQGDIVYSVLHEADFATNLKTGPYHKTQLAQIFEKSATLLETDISPFGSYAPTMNNVLDQKSALHQTKYAFLSTPIFNKQELSGVLAIQLSSNDFAHIARDYNGLKKTGEVVIGQLNGDDALMLFPLRRRANNDASLRVPMGSEIALPIQWSLMNRKGSGLSVGYEGTEILAAWRYIPELKWGMVVKIEAAEAFASASKLEQNLLIIGLLVVLVASTIAIIFSNRISAPIVHLSEATRKIMDGDLSEQIETTSSDEIGLLAQNFNEMTGRLKSMIMDLEQNNFALEQSNKELDNFAYVASHDLKSPLRGIDQLATWIEEDIDDKEETAKHLKMMRIRVRRMENLLEDLLAYSRVGRIEEKIHSVDTGVVLQTLFELATPPEEFKFELEGDFPTFDTVSVPFQMVFRNLISNAIKHHDREDGLITVSVEDLGESYNFKIKDDGPGIAEEYHEKIFGLFQTLRSRDEVEGSGMGLAIIRKTAQMYGCDITVQSSEGQGACFIVVWPKKIDITK